MLIHFVMFHKIARQTTENYSAVSGGVVFSRRDTWTPQSLSSGIPLPHLANPRRPGPFLDNI